MILSVLILEICPEKYKINAKIFKISLKKSYLGETKGKQVTCVILIINKIILTIQKQRSNLDLTNPVPHSLVNHPACIAVKEPERLARLNLTPFKGAVQKV